MRFDDRHLPPEHRVALLARLARFGETADDVAMRVFARELRVALDRGYVADLPSAVGLVRPGGVSARRAEALASRDAALRRLRGLIWPHLSNIAAARAIIEAFEQYETRRWPRDRRADALPEAEPAATFAALLHDGLRPPRTPHHLAHRLEKNSHGPLNLTNQRAAFPKMEAAHEI